MKFVYMYSIPTPSGCQPVRISQRENSDYEREKNHKT